MAVTVLTPIMLITYAVMLFGIYNFSSEIDTFTSQKKRADILMAEARKKADSLPEDIDRVTDAVDLYEMLSQGENTPLDTVNAFRQAMNDDVRVKSMDWKVGDFIKIKEDAVPQLTANFEVEFTKEWSLEEFHKNATAFFERLKKRFPDYEVTHSKLPGTIGENEDLEVNFDEAQTLPQRIALGEVTIVVTIVGPKAAEADEENGKDKKKKGKNKKKVKG
ncbi:MAG: hypothetical protein IT567_01945 [Alphaproteobacteria bacterium]|nr:hypothetical protein [Alphaproteobacteria bacterium]